MTEIINDSKEEAVVAEEVTEAPVEVVVEEAVEAVVEAPVVEAVVEEKPKAAPKKAKTVATTDGDTVAVFSERNINWDGVGKLQAGYNLVSKKAAEQWLSGSLKVRLATPEEVAAKVAN